MRNFDIEHINACEDSQLSVDDEGIVFFQPDSTNPLKGEQIASLTKGQSIFEPKITAEEKYKGASDRLELWLKTYVSSVLSPLFEKIPENNNTEVNYGKSLENVVDFLRNNLGIIKRADIKKDIESLSLEEKRILRQVFKVRLGSVFIFVTTLNRPACIKLKALLWSLYNEQKLPACLPNDGIVSFVIDNENIDSINELYYRIISYPVYGKRATRVDMLDRVISEIYDSSAEGKFRASHKMAEWLGCTIDDLYLIIESMGHKKIDASSTETVKENNKDDNSEKEAMPLLSEFILAPVLANKQKKEQATEKPNNKKSAGKENITKQNTKRKKSRLKEKKLDYTSEKLILNPDDSPFAILEQLKTKQNG